MKKICKDDRRGNECLGEHFKWLLSGYMVVDQVFEGAIMLGQVGGRED
jgi:hypothetical protein